MGRSRWSLCGAVAKLEAEVRQAPNRKRWRIWSERLLSVSEIQCHERRRRSRAAHEMRVRHATYAFSNGDRVCDLCSDEIPQGEAFHAMSITLDEASDLLDVDDPGLVPTWTQLPSGVVRLDLCRVCKGWVDEVAEE